MTTYTTPYTLPQVEGTQKTAVGSDLNALANATNSALGDVKLAAQWPHMEASLDATADIDNLPMGARSVWNGSVAETLGFPTVDEGVVITYRYGNIDQQVWLPAGSIPQVWRRTKRSTGWTSWFRTDAGGVTVPTPASASGTKRVPLALSATASNSTTTTQAAGTVRLPLRYAATIQRFRLHVSNRLERGDLNIAGAVNLTGIWFGGHAPGSAAFSAAPTQLHGASTLPADGTEWVSPWLPARVEKNSDYLLSVGFTTAGQSSALATAGGWVSASSTVGPQQDGTGFSLVNAVPLSWWIEAEVPAAVPVLAGFGDSNTVGTGTTLEVFDSWLSQHCRTVGALPLHQAYPGTAMSEWRYATWLWERWDAYARADAVLVAIGQNDLEAGITVAEMQARLGDMVPELLEHVAPVIHLATITPTSTKPSEINTVRQGYNDYLLTGPHGAHDWFDFAAAVDDGTGTALGPTYAHSDGLHMVTAGHTALAQSIVRAPIAPAWA